MNLTHAGGIVYQLNSGNKLYLLTTATNNQSQWVLPKGHLEAEETPEFTAIREVIEEAGILAMPLRIVGHQSYKKENEDVVAQYYLMKYINKVSSPLENRLIKWLPLPDAIELLTFNDAKELMKSLY